MASTSELVRSKIIIEPTARDKGARVTLEIGDYDNGIMTVNGQSLGGMDGDNITREQAVAEVYTFVSIAVERLLAAGRKRKAERAEAAAAATANRAAT